MRPEKPDPQPLWENIGTIDLYHNKEEGFWQVFIKIDDFDLSVEMEETTQTPGQAVDIALTWAEQRGLILTWPSMQIRKPLAGG